MFSEMAAKLQGQLSKEENLTVVPDVSTVLITAQA